MIEVPGAYGGSMEEAEGDDRKRMLQWAGHDESGGAWKDP